MITIYYFEGSGGCERCQSATMYSFEEPDPPHPYCQCPIEEVDANLDDFDIEYRNVLVLDDVDEVTRTEILDNCEGNADVTLVYELEEEEVEDIPDGLAEAAGGEWSVPETEESEGEVDVPEGYYAEVEIGVYRYVVDLLADVYLVGTYEGETFEVELEPEEGHYEKNVRFSELDVVDSGPCMYA
jgi:hypothetical protein